MCLLVLRKAQILLMHSVPDCQGQLAEQIWADTGMEAKQQLQEKIGLTRLIGIYQSTSNAIHTFFFFFF